MESCPKAKYECLLFDMDDTLYPPSLGINSACRKNTEEFMIHHLHIKEDQVPNICFELYQRYGTTMAGLKALGYEFDIDEFHAYVHGRLPYHLLKPDPELRSLLLSMPQSKIIFSNSDQAHVAKVLSRLDLEDCFQGIICFETLNNHNQNSSAENRIICKPLLQAMEAAVRIATTDPDKTLFFDDSVRNITSGKEAGLHTVIVGRSDTVPGADYALSSIHDIRESIPEICEYDDNEDKDNNNFNNNNKGENVQQRAHSSSSDEAAVAA